MEFKDIGILPEDSPYYQEASRIFFEAFGSQYQPATPDSSVVKP